MFNTVLTSAPDANLRISELLRKCRSVHDLSEAGILFHGSGEPINGRLKVSSVDGMLWTARSPAIAQAYIPKAGLSTFIACDQSRRGERISPGASEEVTRWALERCGASWDDLEIERDARGHVASWRIPTGWPRWGDLEDELHALGYRPGRHGQFKVSVSSEDGSFRIMPENWRLAGHLFILHVPDLVVNSLGVDGDLTDPQHLWGSEFMSAETRGHEAVEIGDFLQSDRWGNVGHRAVGLFQAGLERASYCAIPASNFDFSSLIELTQGSTPEFQAAMEFVRSQVLETAGPGY